MRMRRIRNDVGNDIRADVFLNEILEEINKKGIKNAVFILLGDNDGISVISAFDNSIQVAGIIDLGKTCFHNDVLSDED